MKNIQIILVFTLSLIIISCSDNSQTTETEKEVETEAAFTGIIYTNKEIEVKDDECDESPCSEVTLIYPVVEQGSPALTPAFINDQIKTYILSGALGSNDSINDIDEAARQFIKDFQSFQGRISDRMPSWSIDVDVAVIHNDVNFLSIRVNETSFMGGAHPNRYSKFLNFNTATGKPLTINQLVVDDAKLIELAEEAFRAEKNLAADANLNDEGYLFENNEFVLPENFGIENNQLILHYNSYEIAPYAMGETTLKIPLDKVI